MPSRRGRWLGLPMVIVLLAAACSAGSDADRERAERAEAQVTALQADLATAQAEAASAASIIGGLESELAVAQADLRDAVSRLASVEQTFERLQGENASILASLADLNEHWESVQASVGLVVEAICRGVDTDPPADLLGSLVEGLRETQSHAGDVPDDLVVAITDAAGRDGWWVFTAGFSARFQPGVLLRDPDGGFQTLWGGFAASEAELWTYLLQTHPDLPAELATCVDLTPFIDTPTFPGFESYWARVPNDEAVFGGPDGQQIYSVTAGGPGLVGVGFDRSGGDSDAAVWVSADGYTWIRVPHSEAVFGGPGNQQMTSVTGGGPGLVAVGDEWSGIDGDAAVWVSADGYTWTRIPHDEAVFGGVYAQAMVSVAAGGPGLAAVGLDAPADDWAAAVWVSADGYTWTRVPHDEAVFGGPSRQSMTSVTAGGPGLVAVGDEGYEYTSDGAVWVSADGYTWTRIPHDEALFGGPGIQHISAVIAGGPGLVAVGADAPTGDWSAAVWVSADGYTWTRVPHDEAVFGGPGIQQIVSVTVGGPGLVAGGLSESGTDSDAAVWVSADGYTWTRTPHDEAVFGGSGNQWLSSVVLGGPGLVAVGADWPSADDAPRGAAWVSPPSGPDHWSAP